MASVAALPASAAAPVDPVFAKIEEHRAAIVVWLASDDDDAEGWNGYIRTQQAMLDTPPTTHAGVKALLQFGLDRADIESSREDLPDYIEAALAFSHFAAGGPS